MPESIQKKNFLTILTVREVAEYLRLSEAKVYRLAKERRLPAIRIGKAWRFRKDLLDDWLSQCTESGWILTDCRALRLRPLSSTVLEGVTRHDCTMVCLAKQTYERSSLVGTA